MAYATAKSRNQQIASAGLVAALHVGVGAALLATFAGGFTETLTQPFRAVTIPPDAEIPPPPPPVEKVIEDPAKSVIVMPRPDFSLVPVNPDNIIIPDTGINDKVSVVLPTGPIGAGVEPSPTPTSSFLPRVARPKTNPGTWATTIDYP